MGQHGKFKGDQQGFLSMLQAMRADVRGSSAIQWVLQLQRAFASNNFVRFFALVRRAPYLLACLSHIYFGQVGARARASNACRCTSGCLPAVLQLPHPCCARPTFEPLFSPPLACRSVAARCARWATR